MWLSSLISAPLISYILAFSFGAFLGRGVPILLIFGLSTMILEQLIEWSSGPNELFYSIGTWFQMDLFCITIGWMLDSLTITMFVVVTGVSTLVHLYSVGYMSEDPFLPKFMSYLTLFTAFMLILVSAENLVQLFIGWEGVGLCSFLLISFWYTRLGANKAAIKAMLVNRIGDAGIIFALSLCFVVFRTVDFDVVSCLLSSNTFNLKINFLGGNYDVMEVICAFLLIGAIGKSAQIGLHIWLPDAMEGPTPVSALIHAATMVTAGVFLVIRCSTWFEHAPNILLVMCYVGGWTALFAGSCGVAQHDMKKIIAYSTCSQLGYMLVCCGLSQYSLGLFHLFTHAFFKALLFLSAGAVIHNYGGEQDLRKMGGAIHMIPLPYIMFWVGSLALMGFPFLSGFYSKDVILEVTQILPSSVVPFLCCLFAAVLTTVYSMKLLFYGFWTQINSCKPYLHLIHANPKTMVWPLLILFTATLFAGFIFNERIIGLGSDWLSNVISINSNNVLNINSEFLDIKYKLLPLLLTFVTISIYFLTKSSHWSKKNSFIFKILNNSWYYNKVYMYVFVVRTMMLIWSLGMVVWNMTIQIVEGKAVQYSYALNRMIGQLHTGNMKDYYLITVNGFILLVIFLFIYA